MHRLAVAFALALPATPLTDDERNAAVCRRDRRRARGHRRDGHIRGGPSRHARRRAGCDRDQGDRRTHHVLGADRARLR
eukprot:810350-Prymnesium_polylepis.1